MELKQFDGLPVRVTDTDGRVFEGVADMDLPGYGLHEFGREEESVSLGRVCRFRFSVGEKARSRTRTNATHSSAASAAVTRATPRRKNRRFFFMPDTSD